MGQTDPVEVPFYLIEIQTERRAFDQILAAVREHTHAQLGTLQIGKDRYGRSKVIADLADDAVTFGNLLVTAVGHVEPKHIGARLVQCADHVIGA